MVGSGRARRLALDSVANTVFGDRVDNIHELLAVHVVEIAIDNIVCQIHATLQIFAHEHRLVAAFTSQDGTRADKHTGSVLGDIGLYENKVEKIGKQIDV